MKKINIKGHEVPLPAVLAIVGATSGCLLAALTGGFEGFLFFLTLALMFGALITSV